jgi:hypothetical protein
VERAVRQPFPSRCVSVERQRELARRGQSRQHVPALSHVRVRQRDGRAHDGRRPARQPWRRLARGFHLTSCGGSGRARAPATESCVCSVRQSTESHDGEPGHGFVCPLNGPRVGTADLVKCPCSCTSRIVAVGSSGAVRVAGISRKDERRRPFGRLWWLRFRPAERCGNIFLTPTADGLRV